MVRRDTFEFENDISAKYNAKSWWLRQVNKTKCSLHSNVFDICVSPKSIANVSELCRKKEN